jgi:succinate dehydrogenase flavin-adding protein (antitoxin of CptAB toxin-antitoxin module)
MYHLRRLATQSIRYTRRTSVNCLARPTSSAFTRITQNYSTDTDASFKRTRDITRLTYHSRKRGILETTLIFSAFADKHLPQLSEADLADYEFILTCNTWSEWDLYRYLTAKEDRLDAPENLRKMPVFWKIREMVHQSGGIHQSHTSSS